MNTKTHTPGKWIVNGSEKTTAIWVEDTVTDKRVCTVTPGEDDLDRARLIADAPDLLAERDRLLAENAELRTALEIAERDMAATYEALKSGQPVISVGQWQRLESIRAALSRAKGAE